MVSTYGIPCQPPHRGPDQRLGVGTSGLPAAGAKEGAATLEMALEQGINYFDLATADSACFPIFGAALAVCAAGALPGPLRRQLRRR